MAPAQLALALLVALLAISLAQGAVGGDRIRERIGKVIEKEKKRAMEEALDAEFELADKDENGQLSREEFAHYLVKEDHFSLAESRVGTQAEWLGASEEPAKAAAAAGPEAAGQPQAAAQDSTQVPQQPAATQQQQQQQQQQGGQGAGPQGAEPGTHPPLEPALRSDRSSMFTGFWSGCFNSVLMILVTELGDKTFFIAALMAMKHPRLMVYGGAIAALAIMTVLSAAIGSALPAFLPRQYTHYGAALLFVFFGLKMLQEARELYASPPSANEELEEAEEEISNFGGKKEDSLERGTGASPRRGRKNNKWERNVKVLTQSFVMTFLAEWGDRSQIATIALATTKNGLGVTLGGILGHAFCTGLAVVGGRLLATRIEEKQVTLAGGTLFCLFAVHSFVVGPDA